MNGTSGTKGNRLNLLKSNRSKVIFICPLRHVGQEMFHEADEILTNVTSPLRFNSYKSSSLSLPCGRKIYSSVKCYLLTEKYEISTAENSQVLRRWLTWPTSHLFKTWNKRKQKGFLWLRDFYQHQSLGADQTQGRRGSGKFFGLFHICGVEL